MKNEKVKAILMMGEKVKRWKRILKDEDTLRK